MHADAEKPTVVLRPSGRMAFHPRTREDAHELLAALANDDYDVVLQLPDPGQFSAQNSLESIGIYIAGGVSTTLLPLIVKDLHAGIKTWIKKRFAKDENAGAQYVTIYGPDGRPLKNVLGRSSDHIKDVTPPLRQDDARRHSRDEGEGIR